MTTATSSTDFTIVFNDSGSANALFTLADQNESNPIFELDQDGNFTLLGTNKSPFFGWVFFQPDNTADIVFDNENGLIVKSETSTGVIADFIQEGSGSKAQFHDDGSITLYGEKKVNQVKLDNGSIYLDSGSRLNFQDDLSAFVGIVHESSPTDSIAFYMTSTSGSQKYLAVESQDIVVSNSDLFVDEGNIRLSPGNKVHLNGSVDDYSIHADVPGEKIIITIDGVETHTLKRENGVDYAGFINDVLFSVGDLGVDTNARIYLHYPDVYFTFTGAALELVTSGGIYNMATA